MNKLVAVSKSSNREFLETYAQPGRVGLVGGATLIEKAIKRAERHMHPDKQWSLWSHALLFEGKRADGQHWVIESDLEIHRKHIRLGVQENRIAKYFDEEMFTTLAVMDFGLTDDQVSVVLREGLEMVAGRVRYSLRELVGAWFALRHPKLELRSKQNLLARERSMYCSAFVQHVFLKAGIDLAPGVHASHGSPEDISRTQVPHVKYLLERSAK